MIHWGPGFFSIDGGSLNRSLVELQHCWLWAWGKANFMCTELAEQLLSKAAEGFFYLFRLFVKLADVSDVSCSTNSRTVGRWNGQDKKKIIFRWWMPNDRCAAKCKWDSSAKKGYARTSNWKTCGEQCAVIILGQIYRHLTLYLL